MLLLLMQLSLLQMRVLQINLVLRRLHMMRQLLLHRSKSVCQRWLNPNLGVLVYERQAVGLDAST